MRFTLFALLIIATLIANVKITLAQDIPPDTWTQIEHCLPDPMTPEKNWSFDGEILLRGWAGIHGVKASLKTPYVVHWGGGVVSPDGQWVLNQDETVQVEHLRGVGPMGRYHFYYGAITATNLTTGDRRTFPWEGYNSFTSRPYLAEPAGPLWLDNHRFAAFYGDAAQETRIGDVDTGEVSDWTDVSLEDAEISVSPDLTRMTTYAHLYELPNPRQMRDEQVGTNYDFTASVWSPDSSMFADVIRNDDQQSTLTLFDREGTVLATPYTTHDEYGRLGLGVWSPDNRYFSFTAANGHAYLLDVLEKTVIDLCVEHEGGWAWSPDGAQFATILGLGQQPVLITAMTDWQPMIAAYHDGSVLLWRSLP